MFSHIELAHAQLLVYLYLGKIRIPVITDEVEDGPEDTMPPGVDSLLARLAAHGYIVVCVTDVDGEFAIDTLQETTAWVRCG